MKIFILVTLALLAAFAALAISGMASGRNDHNCSAPCTISFSGANPEEDEVTFDYRSGGTVWISRADECDHYCFENMAQRGICPEALPRLLDAGDRWPESCTRLQKRG